MINDKWKEEFLLSLIDNAVPITKFVDNNEYIIWGFPFFNKEYKMPEFESKFEELLNS